ncbi:V-type ATP synthase subunit K [Patescibacteria group bacterium]|nr:V-type ATP synthase subunit K [Patescibacteria group bacterium]MBU1683237.1 V-type ATP synthase subunit K [Patescibacteria group bacterium]
MEEVVTNPSFWGLALAIAGAAFAVAFAGAGSSIGVGAAGQAGAGVTAEKPELFGKVLILEALPATQGIYGFLIAFLILMFTGVLGGDPMDLTVAQGALIGFAGVPVGLAGYWSGSHQGRVSAAGMGTIAKNPADMGKAMVLSAMVETYAVLGFLVSALIVFAIPTFA